MSNDEGTGAPEIKKYTCIDNEDGYCFFFIANLE